jgi:hypothetical protein
MAEAGSAGSTMAGAGSAMAYELGTGAGRQWGMGAGRMPPGHRHRREKERAGKRRQCGRGREERPTVRAEHTERARSSFSISVLFFTGSNLRVTETSNRK